MSVENSDRMPKGDILVVEDDIAALDMMSAILTESGYRVLPASDGELALRSVQAELPDLILLDIKLPGMDGIEVCHTLKSHPATKEVPIIFISAAEQSELKVKALEVGGVDYVAKPIDASEILARIATHLRLHRMQKKLATQSEKLTAEIEERKRAEKELEKHSFQLEDLVRQRTVALQREFEGHKQAQASLVISHKHYQTLFNEAPVPLWEADFSDLYAFVNALKKKGISDFRAYFDEHPEALEDCAKKINIIDVNQATLDLHCAESKSELLGGLDKIFTAKSYSAFKEEVIALAEGQRHFEIEGEVKALSGETRHILLKLTLDRESPDLSRVMLATPDITEKKYAEKNLRENEHRFRCFFENPGIYGYIISPEGIILEVNKTALERLGYTRQEVVGRSLFKLYAKECKKEVEKVFEEWKATGHVRNAELMIQAKNGARRWVALNVDSVRDASGRIVHSTSIQVDITERIKALADLRHELNLNAAVAGISKELIAEPYEIRRVSKTTLKYARELTRSAHGFVSSIDEKTKASTAHTLTDMIGDQCKVKDQKTVFPLEADGKYPALWGHALNTKQPFYCDRPSDHFSSKGLPPGHIPLNNYLAVPVLIEKELVGLIAVANTDKDYTQKDIKSLERLAEIYALAFHRNRYEQEKKSMEDHLRQIQKIEAIGTLAGGIAHDFNNILSPILGMSELLLEDLPAESLERENALEIFNAGKRGGDLVDQILTFSRQTEHRMIPIRVQSILKEVIKLTRSTIPADIRITQDIQSDCPMVMADPTQLHQVAMNLITNAYHAVDASGGDINITLQETRLTRYDEPSRTLLPGRYVKLSVSDTGSGIEPALVDKIFEPYFTTKERGKGTGLGLSVVQGIVQDHKGDILVASSLGEGTVFDILLPVLRRADESAMVEKSRDYQHGTENVLVVDDEAPIVKFLTLSLERLGYRVTPLTSSPEALNLFKTDPEAFDLVMTDMAMPVITGEQLAREIMAIKADLPVILFTGFSARIDRKKAEAIGIKGFLKKPIVPSELAKMVRSVLDKAKSAQIGQPVAGS